MTKSPLENLRRTLGSLDLGTLDVDSLGACISGVRKDDLRSDAKREIVSEFLNSLMILREMVDALNLQVDALESWSWGRECIPVDVRRAQSTLFAADALTGGKVIERLRAKLSTRFVVSDIPDGFFLFPI